MMFFLSQTLILLTVFALQFPNLLSATCDIQRYSSFIKPSKTLLSGAYFQELIKKSDQSDATFQKIFEDFKEHASSFYRIRFRYPLKDEQQAKQFAKLLQIKAQQAHRFVPSMKKAEFIEPRHLGFIRRLDLDGKGFTVQDRILVDKELPRILFIQEWFIDSNGKKQPGNFAAVNAVIQENGHWYFFGEYLYPLEAPAEAIEGMLITFCETYENMLLFLEKDDVDAVLRSLKTF